jgi:hypothetical protein
VTRKDLDFEKGRDDSAIYTGNQIGGKWPEDHASLCSLRDDYTCVTKKPGPVHNNILYKIMYY